ncbi:CDP-alcohol phosphatidyltransferase family protein [Candidatus Woesearchaeota archaeon]|nr:CDP-alcohol phosphatidyltransferase family protein [Candidatus Woesearchaeota archaeon]
MNYPTVLSWLRMIVTLICYVLLFYDKNLFVIGVFFCAITDFLDGFLARKLKQETVFGAKLDSVADLIFNSSMLLWFYWLFQDFVLLNAFMPILAIVAFLIDFITQFIKHKKIVSLHLWSAKLCAGLFFLLFMLSVLMNKVNPYLFTFVFAIIILHCTEEFIILLMKKNPKINSKTIFHVLWK